MFDTEINRALTAAVELLNTAEGRHSARDSADELTSIENLKSFLSDQDSALKWPVSGLDRDQVDQARQLRSTLAEIWRAAPSTSEEPVEKINTLLEGVGTQVVRTGASSSSSAFVPQHRSAPIPVSDQAADVVTATIADALQHLVVRDETGRMRICRGEDCDAAIIDLTRNRSKLFCDFGNCANRAHVRAYRARQAALREAGKRASDQERAVDQERALDQEAGKEGDGDRLARPSSAEKAAQLREPTSTSGVVAKEFRHQMRDELMDKREQEARRSAATRTSND